MKRNCCSNASRTAILGRHSPDGVRQPQGWTGVAIADLNGDGGWMSISNNAAPPTIYLNNQNEAGNWLPESDRPTTVQSRCPGSTGSGHGAVRWSIENHDGWWKPGPDMRPSRNLYAALGSGDAACGRIARNHLGGGTEQPLRASRIDPRSERNNFGRSGAARLTRIPSACAPCRTSVRGHDHER